MISRGRDGRDAVEPGDAEQVMIGPAAGTISSSLVVAATENNARTAALSQ